MAKQIGPESRLMLIAFAILALVASRAVCKRHSPERAPSVQSLQRTTVAPRKGVRKEVLTVLLEARRALIPAEGELGFLKSLQEQAMRKARFASQPDTHFGAPSICFLVGDQHHYNIVSEMAVREDIWEEDFSRDLREGADAAVKMLLFDRFENAWSCGQDRRGRGHTSMRPFIR